VQKKQK